MDLSTFIEENADEIIVTGGVSEVKIKESEEALGLSFCPEYRDFLARYGMLIGYGVEILGCGRNGTMPVVAETKRFREFGLSEEYIVIRNVDEWIYCINNNDGTVSSWDRSSMNHLMESGSFEKYVTDELLEAKENWD